MPTETTRYPKTIILKGDLSRRKEEYPANAALKPGHILELISTGKVQKNGTTLQTYVKMVATEDVLYNGRTIDDAYAEDDKVQVFMPQPGDLLWLRVAAGAAAITKGMRLKTANDGTLLKTTVAADAIFGIAEEALDNSLGASEAFLRVRVA